LSAVVTETIAQKHHQLPQLYEAGIRVLRETRFGGRAEPHELLLVFLEKGKIGRD
jgi:hypothetical protein